MTNHRGLSLPRSSVSRRAAMLGGGAGLMGLGLAACGSDDGGSGSGGDSSGGGTIKLGYISSWSDGLSMAYLLDNLLTKMGFEVEHTQISDAGLLYAGLSEGDVDINPSGWPEVTHKAYMDEYGDKIEDLDAWYEGAKLNLSVPSYVDVSSVEDLVGEGDRFGGRIVGIEPGAGLTGATQDSVMPEYGLDEDFELVTSSTPAMLTELGSAIDSEDDIVVTLWTPFWANSTYDVKALEDPKDAFGDAEALHILGREGFMDEFPEVADYLSQIKISDDDYNALEDLVVNEYGEGKEADAVEAWLEKYPDVVPAPPEA